MQELENKRKQFRQELQQCLEWETDLTDLVNADPDRDDDYRMTTDRGY